MKWSYIEEMTCEGCGESHRLEISGPLAYEEHKRVMRMGSKFHKEHTAYTAIGAPTVSCQCNDKESGGDSYE